MSILYIVSSPLHLISSTLLASSDEHKICKKVVLLIGKNKARSLLFLEILNTWKGSPFQEISCENIKTASDAEKIILKYTPHLIITGNDLLPEFCAISYIARKMSIPTGFMDDGLHSYMEYRKHTHMGYIFHIKNLYRRLTKGYTKPRPHTIGCHPSKVVSFLFNPESIKQNANFGEMERILKKQHQIDTLRSLAHHWLHLKTAETATKNSTVLIILPHYTRLSTSLILAVNKIIKTHSETYNILIKNHPSNSDNHLDNIEGINTTKIMQKEIPAEIIALTLPELKIYSGLTTTLITIISLHLNHDLEIINSQNDNTNLITALKKYSIDNPLK